VEAAEGVPATTTSKDDNVTTHDFQRHIRREERAPVLRKVELQPKYLSKIYSKVPRYEPQFSEEEIVDPKEVEANKRLFEQQIQLL
jgi:hypothetical protein